MLIKAIRGKSDLTATQLDLNLLLAFDALLTEGSVGGAAERLRLSVPGMSRTLGRLRRATGDQILVRTGQTMTPTAYALEVRAEIHDLLQRVQGVLAPGRELDLATLERTFTLRCHDAIAAMLGPPLLASIQDQAPGVLLRMIAEGSGDSNELRQGLVDFEINSHLSGDADIVAEALGRDRFVLVARRDHPLMSGELTAERFAQGRQITVSRRGRLSDPIDEALRARGLTRRVVAAVPTVLVALQLARRGDLVVPVAGSINRPMIRALDLQARPLPLDLPPLDLMLSWHRRNGNDRGHTWMRNLVTMLFRAAIEPDQGVSRPDGAQGTGPERGTSGDPSPPHDPG